MGQNLAVPGRLYWKYDTTPAGSNVVTRVVVSAMRELTLSSHAFSSDEVREQVEIDPRLDHEIYGDRVVVHGRISAPERTIKIFARVLVFELGTDGSTPGIDVSGVAGHDQSASNPQTAGNNNERPKFDGGRGVDGTPGLTGGRGTAAGTIELYCDEIELKEVGEKGGKKPVRPMLVAKGGRGGSGQPGMNATNGNGGAPAQSHSYGGKSIYSYYTEGGAPGPGGDAGRAGRGGDGGDGGTLRIAYSGAARTGEEPRSHFEIDVSAGDAGKDPLRTDGKLADGSPGGGGVTPGIGDRKSNDGGKGYADKYGSPGGYTPKNPLPAPSPGKTKAPDIPTCSREKMVTALLPTHALMLLNRLRAEMLTLGIGGGHRDRVRPTLDWLFDILEGVKSATNLDEESAMQLTEVGRDVGLLHARDLLKKDIFGNSQNWAPQPNTTDFWPRLERAVRRLDTVKPLFDEYEKSLKGGTLADMTAARNSARALQEMLEPKYAALKVEADETLAKIGPRSDQIRASLDRLTKLGNEFESAIYLKFSCDLKSVLDAVQMCSFNPPVSSHGGKTETSGAGVVMAGAAAVGLLSEGFGKVRGADGYSADKDFIIHRTDQLSGDIQKSASKIYTDAYGMFKSNKDWARMQMSLDDLDKLLAPFESVDEVKDYLSEIRELTRNIGARSDDIAEYNGLLMQIREVEKDLNATTEEALAKLPKDKNVDELGPAIGPLTAFWAYRYQRDLEDAIECVYSASRAYGYWALEPTYNVFEEILAPNSYWVMDDVSGHLTPETIRECKAELDRKFASAAMRFKTIQDKVKVSGFRFAITDKRHLDAFKQNRSVDFDFRREAITGQFAIPAFEEYGNIRLTQMHVFLDGAKTSQDTVTLRIAHGVSDTFYDPNTDDRAIFIHDASVHTAFTYRVEDNEPVSHGIFSDPGHDRGIWVGIGPFTTWTLRARTESNPDLNLDDLTGIRVEFYGWVFPMAKYASKTRGGAANG